MRLARESVVFRNMHCAAPTCTPSRIALLTGLAPHSAGVLGLAHRGWALDDTTLHLASLLRQHGYHTALSGTQHEHTDPRALGYERILPEDLTGTGETVGQHTEDAAVSFIKQQQGEQRRPFFLSVGFDTTHRTFPEPLPEDDELYCRPPEPLPDNAVTRRDMACYKRAAALLDQQMGRVLQAVDDAGLRDNTLVICTTDHGIAFPFMKCHLTDHGTGVFYMMRWPEKFRGGRVTDALTSHLDLLPTLCEWLGCTSPATLQGRSLAPVLADVQTEIHDEIFAEVTFHAAAEPMRSVRTSRWLYIRRWNSQLRPVAPTLMSVIAKNGWSTATWLVVATPVKKFTTLPMILSRRITSPATRHLPPF